MKKTLAIVSVLLLITACSQPINAVKFGKRCIAQTDKQDPEITRVSYSYVWFYNKQAGMDANKKDCDHLVIGATVK